MDASATASIQIFNDEVTGNTGVMAHMIAEASGGDLFSIRTTEPYPDSYEGTIDAGEDEKNNDARPELSTHIENLEQYDTVFVGFQTGGRRFLCRSPLFWKNMIFPARQSSLFAHTAAGGSDRA